MQNLNVRCKWNFMGNYCLEQLKMQSHLFENNGKHLSELQEAGKLETVFSASSSLAHCDECVLRSGDICPALSTRSLGICDNQFHVPATVSPRQEQGWPNNIPEVPDCTECSTVAFHAIFSDDTSTSRGCHYTEGLNRPVFPITNNVSVNGAHKIY